MTALEPDLVPAPTAAAVRACSYDAWGPLFREHAIRAETILLPPAATQLLLADGVQLRSDSAAMPARAARDPDADSAFTAEEEAEEEGGVARLPELEAAVEAAIGRLGGAVLPKLNWSAPKDAVWLTVGGSLRCANAEEVLLLLAASDAAAHDLCHAYAQCADAAAEEAPPTPPLLVLKTWLELRPALEFRCFVRGRRLLAVSQRHCADFFPFLPERVPELAAQLAAFHAQAVAPVFPQPDYTYDVYVSTAGRVRLLDFNPYGGATLPLLFTWAELAGLAPDAPPPLRVVETPLAIRPGLRLGVPLELYDTSAGSALAEFIAAHRDEATPGGRE